MRALWANLACYTLKRRSFCSVPQNLDDIKKEALLVAGATVGSYVHHLLISKGVDLTLTEFKKIESEVQQRLRVALAPVLSASPIALPPPPPDFYEIKSPHANFHARVFFADMTPDKIWRHLNNYLKGTVYMHAEDVTAALLHVSRASSPDPSLATPVLWKMRSRLDRLKSRHLATLFRACYQFGIEDKMFYLLLFQRMQALEAELDFRALAEIIVCSADLHYKIVPIHEFLPLFNLVKSRMTMTYATSTSRLLHALCCSTWLESPKRDVTLRLIHSVLEMYRHCLTSLNAIDVAQSLYALHVLGSDRMKEMELDSHMFVRNLCEQGLRTIRKANALDVAEMLRGAAFLQDSRMFQGLCVHAKSKLAENASTKALNDMMWSLGRFEDSPEATELCKDVCERMKQWVDQFNANQLSYFMESISYLKVDKGELYVALCEQARRCAVDFTPAMIIRFLGGCVRLGFEHKPLMDAFSARVAKFHAVEISPDLRAQLTDIVSKLEACKPIPTRQRAPWTNESEASSNNTKLPRGSETVLNSSVLTKGGVTHDDSNASGVDGHADVINEAGNDVLWNMLSSNGDDATTTVGQDYKVIGIGSNSRSGKRLRKVRDSPIV